MADYINNSDYDYHLMDGNDPPPYVDPNNPNLTPSNTTATGAGNPWTDDDLAKARARYQTIPGVANGQWGTANDGLNAYQSFRSQGQDHDTALASSLSQLGWGSPSGASTAQRTGNVQQDWNAFLKSKGYTGAAGRTALPQYVDEFNKMYGYSAKAGNPNASGQIDAVDFMGNGQWTDVIHGGDDAWQWLTDSGQSGPTGGQNGAPSFADLLTPPPGYQAPPRTFNANEILRGGENPNAGREQSLLDLLQGISTGSRPESANQNFQVDPNDPIIKNQVDAYDAAQQRSGRDALDALAERQGTHANLGMETRHAAEARGQATGGFQASLIGQELTARRQEAEQSLQLYSQYMTADQQREAQRQIEELRNAEQQYEFDASQGQSQNQFGSQLAQNARQFAANLGQNAYQFDANQQFLNSPLGS